uniref:Uncharacterized protein n=1 Tax=Leersia perrieri TaxID=77586 RepID=A0A0D9VEE6_9ORYZ
MARLAATAILVTFLLVALCSRVTAGAEAVTTDVPEAIVPDNNEAYNYNAIPNSIPADTGFGDDGHRHFTLVMSPKGDVRPAYFDDQGVEIPVPPSYWEHFRQGEGEGFQAQDQQEMVPVEPANYVNSSEAVVLPVAEPDPDSRTADSAAVVPLQEVQKPVDFDEMAKAWRRRFQFHHGRRFHHRHEDEHEEDEHDHEKAAAAVASPMKRFRVHRHDEEEEDLDSGRKRFHHHDKEDDDSDDEEEEEMARRLIRKALMRGRMPHDGRRRFHHHHLRFRHRAENADDDAAGEEKKGGVMKWIKDFVNQF